MPNPKNQPKPTPKPKADDTTKKPDAPGTGPAADTGATGAATGTGQTGTGPVVDTQTGTGNTDQSGGESGGTTKADGQENSPAGAATDGQEKTVETNKAADQVEQPAKTVASLRVQAKVAGFRRAGRAWTSEPQTVPKSELSNEQIWLLKNEPMLIVTEVDA